MGLGCDFGHFLKLHFKLRILFYFIIILLLLLLLLFFLVLFIRIYFLFIYLFLRTPIYVPLSSVLPPSLSPSLPHRRACFGFRQVQKVLDQCLERIWKIGHTVLQEEEEGGKEDGKEDEGRKEEKSVLAMGLFGTPHHR